MLLHLEVRDAVSQQSADPVRLLKHSHCMPSTSELLCAGHAGGARSDHGHGLAGLLFRNLRGNPALFPTPIDNRALD